jgi:RNase P subunit RPR2
MNLIITGIIFIMVVVRLIIASKNKSKLGINLKRVYCPVCNTKQPIVRVPANMNQFMYGGTACPKCKANLDKYGRLVS